MRPAPWTGAIFPPGSRGGPSERLVRLALAVVLLAAAGLKMASLVGGGGRRWPAQLGLGCLAAGSVWLLPPSLLPLENDAGWLRPARQERLLDLSATVGQRFPLLERIDIGRELATGRWRVLLYRRDCPQCRRHLDALRDHDLQAEGLRLALVALPSAHGTPPVDRCADCRQGRLDLPGGWVLATPWDVTLQDGIVVSARSPENLKAAQAGL